MSLLNYLKKHAPRTQKYMDLSRANGPIFAETAERYMAHMAGETSASDKSLLAARHGLILKVMLREEAAIGAHLRSQQVGDESEATLYATHAEKHAQFAIVLAFAMQKKAFVCAPDTQADEVEIDIEPFTTRVIGNILSSFEGIESILRLYDTLSAAALRGWAKICQGDTLPILNGANWCPDTANIAEIANALSVPLVMMFFEYIQLPEERGRRKHGILQIHDHAQAVFEDGFASPKIPVVTYPNHVAQFEPKPYQFVEQLATNGFL